jgi:predicted transcriptional regulator
MKQLDSHNRPETEQRGRIIRKNKVIECLKDRELNYKQIMQETKLKYPSVIWMLRDLEQAKIIKSRFVDGNKLYYINDPSPPNTVL